MLSAETPTAPQKTARHHSGAEGNQPHDQEMGQFVKQSIHIEEFQMRTTK